MTDLQHNSLLPCIAAFEYCLLEIVHFFLLQTFMMKGAVSKMPTFDQKNTNKLHITN